VDVGVIGCGIGCGMIVFVVCGCVVLLFVGGVLMVCSMMFLFLSVVGVVVFCSVSGVVLL